MNFAYRSHRHIAKFLSASHTMSFCVQLSSQFIVFVCKLECVYLIQLANFDMRKKLRFVCLYVEIKFTRCVAVIKSDAFGKLFLLMNF